MRGFSLSLLIVPMLIISGCSMMNDFGEFSFGQEQGSLDGGGGGGNGGGGNDGGSDSGGDSDGGNGGNNGGNNGPMVDGGNNGGTDAGPPIDPICAAAACDPVAICNSSTGVAVCACPMGYIDMNGDGTVCRDVNECKAGIDACDEHSVCENTAGSYKCNCNIGFFFDKVSNTCIDDCIVLVSTVCDEEALCLKPDGYGVCRCPFGFKDVSAAKDGSQCEADDDCAGLTCDTLALCDTTGASPVCKCPDGYSGNGTTCTDVNECASNNGGCNANASCTNTAGGRICECKDGFTGDGVSCTDIDECASADDNNCDKTNGTCANTPGAFTCGCKTGFSPNADKTVCTDIDECAAGACAAGTSICTNTAGSHSCRCKDGYTGDGNTCADVNECNTNNGNCGTGVVCSNSPGSYECGCGPGMRKNQTGACVDINECAENLANCNANATCANVVVTPTAPGPPLFTCTCKSGYTGNGVTCDDVNECLANNGGCSANATCTNNIGAPRSCACKPGFTGDGLTCTDINECLTNNGGCSVNANCTNTAGSRTCACKTGYSGDGLSCTDNNECALGTANCSVNANCTNTSGSFTCACKSGYTGNGVTCSDINECTGAATDPCDDLPTASCSNSPAGSYTCTCPAGYSGSGVGQTGCCTPDGSNDTALPNDGKDNECDGFIDRPLVNAAATFPEAGGAAGGTHVSIAVSPPLAAVPAINRMECRSYKRSTPVASIPAFATCANPIAPFGATASASEANNGAWRTDVVWVYTSGARSNTTSYDYYVHHSLHNAPKCNLGVTDATLFSAADTLLNASLVGAGYADQGGFKLGTETFLANPFVTVGYQPITGGYFSLRRTFNQSVNPSTVYQADMWSLRHRFVAGGANNRYILIRRAYASRTALRFNAADVRCTAAKFKVLDSSYIKNLAGGWGSSMTGHSCDAVVVNRAGAGVCFSVSKGTITRVAGSIQNLPGSSGWGYGNSNKFYWRLLLDEQGWHGKWVGASPAPESGFRNFSEKCDTAGCNSDNGVELFLPDRSILRP